MIKEKKLEFSMKHLYDSWVKMIDKVRYIKKNPHTFTLINENVRVDVALSSF